MALRKKVVEDDGKEIWLLRLPQNISLEELAGMKVSLEAGEEGDVVGRLKGAAAAATDVLTNAFGGDLVIREELNDDDAWRPLVKGKDGAVQAASRAPARILAACVEHDAALTEMDVHKYTPAIVLGRESTFSEEPIGEEYLGPDFAARTKYEKDLYSRAAYRGKIQKKGMRCRFFPNATREPEGIPSGAKAPAAAPAAEEPKKKASEKKKKKRDRGDLASPDDKKAKKEKKSSEKSKKKKSKKSEG